MKSLIKSVLAVVLAFIGWMLRKAQDDRVARDTAEAEAKSAHSYADKLMQIEVDHEKMLQEINSSFVPDDRAAELLSEGLGQNISATATKNAKS